MPNETEARKKLIADFAALALLKDETDCHVLNLSNFAQSPHKTFFANFEQIKARKIEPVSVIDITRFNLARKSEMELAARDAARAAERKEFSAVNRVIKNVCCFEDTQITARAAYERIHRAELLREQEEANAQIIIKEQIEELNGTLEQIRLEKKELAKAQKTRKLLILFKDLTVVFTVVNYFIISAAIFNSQVELLVGALALVCAVTPFSVFVAKKYGSNLLASVWASFFVVTSIFDIVAFVTKNLQFGLAGLIANLVVFIISILYSPKFKKKSNKL